MRDRDDNRVRGLFRRPTQRELAENCKVSVRTLKRAARVGRRSPALTQAVKEGIVSVRAAEDMLDVEPEILQEALAAVRQGREPDLRTAVRGAAKMASAETDDLRNVPRSPAALSLGWDDPTFPECVYSPVDLVMVAQSVLGGIDLGPASSADGRQATVEPITWYGPADNAASRPWKGKVYCFPPPNEISIYVDKIHDELAANRVKSAIFVAPGEQTTEWAHKLYGMQELSMVVHQRGRQWLDTASPTAGAVPEHWRPRTGLTVYVIGVAPSRPVIDALSTWGYVFRAERDSAQSTATPS